MSADRSSSQQSPQEALWSAFVAARRSLRREFRRRRRLQSRLQADLDRAEGAGAMRQQGEALKYCLDQVPSGADRVALRLPWGTAVRPCNEDRHLHSPLASRRQTFIT